MSDRPIPPRPEPRMPSPFVEQREHWTQVLIVIPYAVLGICAGLLAALAL